MSPSWPQDNQCEQVSGVPNDLSASKYVLKDVDH